MFSARISRIGLPDDMSIRFVLRIKSWKNNYWNGFLLTGTFCRRDNDPDPVFQNDAISYLYNGTPCTGVLVTLSTANWTHSVWKPIKDIIDIQLWIDFLNGHFTLSNMKHCLKYILFTPLFKRTWRLYKLEYILNTTHWYSATWLNFTRNENFGNRCGYFRKALVHTCGNMQN